MAEKTTSEKFNELKSKYDDLEIKYEKLLASSTETIQRLHDDLAAKNKPNEDQEMRETAFRLLLLLMRLVPGGHSKQETLRTLPAFRRWLGVERAAEIEVQILKG